jgi:hypothetical protein
MKKTELIKDPVFRSGFNVRGLSSVKDGTAVRAVFNYGKDGPEPFWVLAQWDSKYSFADPSVTHFKDEGDGIYKYINPSKLVTVDTKKGSISMKEYASECYDKPRKAGEAWPHLLIEAGFCESGNDNNYKEKINISAMERLNIHLKTRLTYFEDRMDGNADASLHAAQFLLYLYVQNLSSKNEPGYGDKIWFGLPIFDSRYEFSPQYSGEDAGKDDASHQFIYNVGAADFLWENFFKDGKPFGSIDNKWVNIEIDVLPHIKAAYKTARERGYLKETAFEKLYVSGMNMGWELPGTYDVEMQVEDLGIDAYGNL